MMMENSMRMTMNGLQTYGYIPDAQWVQIQQNTFKNWVNEQLKDRNVVINDLQEDLRNGVVLVMLLEELANKSIVNFIEAPQNQHEKLQNVAMALDVLSRDGVKVTNIDSTDIVRGNIKVILTLVWQLILRYQVGLSAVQHRQWFLKWLKAVLPDYNITNFCRDWNDGVTLYALIEFCSPGLCSQIEISRHDRLNNCRNSMKLAKHHLGVPIVLRPEDLASPDLDERSAITYLSYFIKHDGPGYLATLDRIQKRLPSKRIANFTTDWQDGEALAELVTSSGHNLPNIQEETPVEVIKKCINAGRFLGVEPVLTAEEITEENKEHLGIMTYVAQYLPHTKQYVTTIPLGNHSNQPLQYQPPQYQQPQHPPPQYPTNQFVTKQPPPQYHNNEEPVYQITKVITSQQLHHSNQYIPQQPVTPYRSLSPVNNYITQQQQPQHFYNNNNNFHDLSFSKVSHFLLLRSMRLIICQGQVALMNFKGYFLSNCYL